MRFLDQRVLVGFGFHPLTNEYHVVRIIYYQNVHDGYPHSVPVHSESEVQVYSMDSNNWRLIGRYLIRSNAGHQNFYWLMAGFTGYVDLVMVGSIVEKLSHLILLMSISERYQHLNGVGYGVITIDNFRRLSFYVSLSSFKNLNLGNERVWG